MQLLQSQLPWTEEQWNQVDESIRAEACKVRVARLFLPIDGPYPRDAETVSLQEVRQEDTGETRALSELADYLRRQGNQGASNLPRVLRGLESEVREVEHSARRMRGESQERLLVDATRTRPLTKISVNVYLKSAQVEQQDLYDAHILFRRAANFIARVEDRIVFGGQPCASPDPRLFGIQPYVYRVSGGEQFRGLIAEAVNAGQHTVIRRGAPTENLVTAVAQAISDLENEGHLGPFGLVLGSNLFVMAHTPSSSLVLPADRIKPLLGEGGALLRSTTIDEDEGVLVSLAADLVDLVVASDISAKYLQSTLEPRHVVRVSERITLRVKQPRAIMAFVPN